jgi:glutathione synthase/RimK-type ligase-like ATP-grasp enzyme
VLASPELDRIPEMMEEHGWHEAVLKPAFSARAYDAYRFPRHRAMEVVGEAVSLEASERWLVQPFLPDIVHGELSFIFIDGVFSHAVKKVPPSGEWRVQEFHGGLVEPIDVSDDSVMQAAAMLEQATPSTLYARVDCVVVDGRLTLMELELVEPELFFRFEPEAATRFADALARRLAAQEQSAHFGG